MTQMLEYTVFKTKWGFFGLSTTEKGLYRSVLPLESKERVKSILLKDLGVIEVAAIYNTVLESDLQQSVKDYFCGQSVDFHRVKCDFSGFPPFSVSVLKALQGIRYSKISNYKKLAEKAGFPNAARAVGTVLKNNRLPLIVPCHRIIRCDGRLGGFSAPGGIKTKQKMLDLEKRCPVIF